MSATDELRAGLNDPKCIAYIELMAAALIEISEKLDVLTEIATTPVFVQGPVVPRI